MNWVLINDESHFGVTVHYIDEGIDTGDIIHQELSEITDRDDYSSLLDRSVKLCAKLLLEALIDIENDDVARTRQKDIHPVGTYYGRRVIGDEWIDWNWTSRRIFNFIRAIKTPGPCARTICGTSEVVIESASIIENAPKYLGTCGEVVGIEGNSIIVKTGDSTINIQEYSIKNQDNILSQESLRKIGVRFLNQSN